MDREAARDKLKRLLIAELGLEGKTPADIDDDTPLLRQGLGLSSLDALQIGLAIEEHFGVEPPDGEQARPLFASINALLDHILRSVSEVP